MSVSLETDPLSWGYPEGQDTPSRASAEAQINSSSKLHSWAREPTGATVSSSLEFAPPCLRGFQTLLTKHHDDHPARSRLICSRDLQFNRKRSIIPPLTLVQQPQKQTPVKTLPIALELGALATLCWPYHPQTVSPYFAQANTQVKPCPWFLFWNVTLGLSIEERNKGKMVDLRGPQT